MNPPMNPLNTTTAGGKAAVLMELEKNGFPVPPGFAVLSEPTEEAHWVSLLHWWRSLGAPKVAARSSAQGEDGAANSFAGQFITVLQISNEAELRAAVIRCFQAVNQKNSLEYTRHFSQNAVQMRVYVQCMIQSEFSGVYFSQDPRGLEDSWLLEAVHGQGEQLVSGQVTPLRFSQNHSALSESRPGFEHWPPAAATEIADWGRKVERHLGYAVDMEWALDAQGRFWVLQARPITTFAGLSQKRKWIDQEWNRLQSSATDESAWDGQLFAEWTGLPSEMTFDLWQRAFAPDKAFDRALRSLGYRGLLGDKGDSAPELLQRVFGRGYLNLENVLPIYFGKAPYTIELKPRPHLKFSFHKLNLKNTLQAPMGWWRMLKVAWNLQTRRHELANTALQKLETQDFACKSSSQLYHDIQSLDFTGVVRALDQQMILMTTEVLQATFLMTLLIESTYQGVLALLSKDFGAARANEIGQWTLGHGMTTVTLEMQAKLSQAQDSNLLWTEFLANYGHRGAGELDLKNPRWIELRSKPTKKHLEQKISSPNEIANELSSSIEKLGVIRRETLKQEIEQLHFLLQTREKIKMHTMKLYAQIRWSLLRVANSLNIPEQDIFWLRYEEVQKSIASKQAPAAEIALERQEQVKACLSIDLPQSFNFAEMKRIFRGEVKNNEAVLQGSNLSAGICQGRVHVVIDPASEDLAKWDENTILVAEATDPSWTALFARSKGIVVARGGVLSHCAIVAREMGRPAVGEIQGATHIFKEGEHVWVDGTHGIIRRIT